MTEREWIDNIFKFECSDGRPLQFSNGFIKEKLYNALVNEDIICLARGDGRSRILNDIILHPEILFDWGEKSIHAFLDNKDECFRRFCDPEAIDKEMMIYFINKYAENLKNYYKKYTYFRCNENDVNFFVEKLIYEIGRENNSQNLLYIKEWIMYALHTMGVNEFKRITPCLSCSYGDNRFETARFFGRERSNNYYVIMDSWVNKSEEGIAYKQTDYVNEILKQYGLKWFKNKHKEIMLKYGIFPQQLVGYYLLDRNYPLKYVINKHYVDVWEQNPAFEIGDPIYFEQIIDFEKLGPYNTVYEYNERGFSIAGRRK